MFFRRKFPDRGSECGGIFLWRVMADVRNDAMLAPAGELRCRGFPHRLPHHTIRVP